MVKQTSNKKGIQPAEWEIHEACWVAWPSDGKLWEDNLPAAQAEFAALCRAISGIDYATDSRPAERLEVLVPDAANLAQAKNALAGLPARFHLVPFGDIWLRDTGPIFLRVDGGGLAAARFLFNGWGGKYVLEHDADVSKAVAERAHFPELEFPWVLEGGSVEVDGQGTCLTSRQCLMNPNRNPALSFERVEEELKNALGAEKILWLEDGLLNDHTDGHIDTIARFVGPASVVCMEATDAKDPNAATFQKIKADLASFTDARGRKLHVSTIPSPGIITDDEGEIMPASYLNFYIGNRTVVVPTYGSAQDERAVAAIAALFPDRKTIGLSAKAILSGGGAFHCITQQQPRVLTAEKQR